MDRPRRFLLETIFISIVATVVIGAVWFGYRIGENVLATPPPSRSNAWASSLAEPNPVSDKSAPALLPDCEVVRRANRLEPCEGPDLGSDNKASLVPPSYRDGEPSNSEDATETIAKAETHRPNPQVSTQPDIWPEKVETANESTANKPSTPKISSDGPKLTPWATAYQPGTRSSQLEQAARQADQHTRRGFDLAGRKAYFSARAEFVQALRIVAQGLDNEHHSHVHGQALSAGLTALDEVDDFVPVGSKLEGNLELGDVIKGHKTSTLKLADPQKLTPLQCVRSYIAYARDQLAIAAGGEVAGSMALHALGKLHWSLAERQHASRPIDDTKALVLLQAASEVCQQNYLALNDLGVLLARGGRYIDACDVLEKGAAISQDPTVRINLAAVHRQLGNLRRAEQAEQQATTMLAAQGKLQQNPDRPVPPVMWVAPQKFAKSYAAVAGPWKPAPIKHDDRPQPKPSTAEPSTVKQASRGFSLDWFLKGSNKTISR